MELCICTVAGKKEEKSGNLEIIGITPVCLLNRMQLETGLICVGHFSWCPE